MGANKLFPCVACSVLNSARQLNSANSKMPDSASAYADEAVSVEKKDVKISHNFVSLWYTFDWCLLFLYKPPLDTDIKFSLVLKSTVCLVHTYTFVHEHIKKELSARMVFTAHHLF
jgi:hypothetical protein